MSLYPFAPSPPFSPPCMSLPDEFSLKPALLRFPHGSETFGDISWPKAQTPYAHGQGWLSSGPDSLSSQPPLSSPVLQCSAGVFPSSVTHHSCTLFTYACVCNLYALLKAPLNWLRTLAGEPGWLSLTFALPCTGATLGHWQSYRQHLSCRNIMRIQWANIYKVVRT